MSGYHVGLVHDTTKDERSFDELCRHSQAPGGHQRAALVEELRARGTFTYYAEALDKIMRRVEGR